MPSPDAFPCRNEVPWRTLDTEALVIDAKKGLLYPLNSVGARIWQLSDGSHSVNDIVRTLVGEFDIDEATARSDALTFLDNLASAGLVSIDVAPRLRPADAKHGRSS